MAVFSLSLSLPVKLSWIRQRDLHVLTSAMVSYTSDGRFSVHHQPASDDWELRISSAQARDAGFCKDDEKNFIFKK